MKCRGEEKEKRIKRELACLLFNTFYPRGAETQTLAEEEI